MQYTSNPKVLVNNVQYPSKQKKNWGIYSSEVCNLGKNSAVTLHNQGKHVNEWCNGVLQLYEIRLESAWFLHENVEAIVLKPLINAECLATCASNLLNNNSLHVLLFYALKTNANK